jgi:hypothetical protein
LWGRYLEAQETAGGEPIGVLSPCHLRPFGCPARAL